MVEFPHFFGLDLSAAGPWIIFGLLGGLLLSWLWQARRGARAKGKAKAQIAQMQGLLDASRSEHQADIARLLSDARSYEAALADAERRAAHALQQVSSLRAESQRLLQAELSSRNELLAADKELSKLRSDLQWAQTQSGSLSNERASLSQQAQAVAAELATLRTAAELKDAEIVRLINQLQWQQSKTSTLEQEKHGLESGLNALKFKDGEVARLQDELGAARAQIDRLEGQVINLGQAQAASQLKYDQTWNDLNYMRNLAYWGASEIERLRALITRFEGELAARIQAMGALQQQYATVKARLGGARKGFGGARHHLAYFRRQGTNGTSADVHAHAKGNGKLAFVHKSRDAVKARRKAYKLGKAHGAGGGQGAGGLKPGQGATLIALPSKARGVPGEIADLKAKLAALTQDAEKYRRLREAVHVANRIADDQV